MKSLSSLFVFLTAAFALNLVAAARPIDFVEDFALAPDREEVLKELIPGSREFYYYHAIHFQQTGQLDKVRELMRPWTDRHPNDPMRAVIENRQALLQYTTQPRQSLDFIRRRLGIQFNHQRERLDARPDFPTVLDQDLISRDTLTRRALNLGGGRMVSRFEDRALEWVATLQLNEDQRRDLLRRLSRPDLANLVDLVMTDLASPRSGGFGAAGISVHSQMLTAQLDEMLRRNRDLINQTHFVHIYLASLAPSADVDIKHDLEASEAHLRRLWAFARNLPDAHNSIKAHVLYQLLDLGRRKGEYDRALFEAYIQIPRQTGYIRPELLQRGQRQQSIANLNADFNQFTLHSRIRDDEPLVREYLLHFFVRMDSWRPFEPYIRDTYLKPLFAEAKILAGVGDMEEWASLISPAQLQRLRDRVDIDFVATNRTIFDSGDAVSLALDIKNVERLSVRIFQINTLNYYRAEGREVDTDINLDGLVAAEELTFNYNEPALRRVRRAFDLPQLEGPGVWVVEFIGNGMSSRAVIRKGRLRYIEQPSAAGHLIRIVDERNQPRNRAEVLLDGHRYTAAEDGLIRIPFTNEPGKSRIILIDGDLASLDHLDHMAEEAELEAAFYVDREQLIRFGKADMVIRPRLMISGQPAPLELLEDVRLTIHATDLDGTTSTLDIADFKLDTTGQTVQTINVPQRLRNMTAELTGRVRIISKGTRETVSQHFSLAINQIDQTDHIMALHLVPAVDGYLLELRGKSGEPLADRPVNVALKHKDFRDQVRVSLKTDEQGRVDLGRLTDIDHIIATTPQGHSERWTLPEDRIRQRPVIHTIAGRTVLVPYFGEREQASREELSLLKTTGWQGRPDRFIGDAFERLAIDDGYIQIRNLTPGDYVLTIKPFQEVVRIRVTEGAMRHGVAMGRHRHLEEVAGPPQHLTALEVDEDRLRIRLRNAASGARVTVVASRYAHAVNPFDWLALDTGTTPAAVTLPGYESLYVAGRDLGDEYRYILDRRTAMRFAGNMLERPGILLNPWAVRDTRTTRQDPSSGSDFERTAREAPRTVAPTRPSDRRQESVMEHFANYDFLPTPSKVLANLRPDDNGVITVPLEDLGNAGFIQVLVKDELTTQVRHLVMDPVDYRPRDIRLAEALDTDRKFTQQMRITALKAGDELSIEDMASSRFEIYDSLGQVFRLMLTLNDAMPEPDPRLGEFRFITNWPDLEAQKKRELYSEFASHELHVFLYFKDREFFNEVVRPYLIHKKDKTFIDHWLLEHDLSDYLDPWAFRRLNAAERALLARRLAEQREALRSHIINWHDAVVAPDVERFNRLFLLALEGGALEGRAGAAMLREMGELDDRRQFAEGGREQLELRRARMMADPAEFSGRVVAPGEREAVPPPAGQSDAAFARTGGVRGMLGDEDGQEAMKRIAEMRQEAQRYFQALDSTKEWAENNYYHQEIQKQVADLIPINPFWRDYALHEEGPFLSSSFNMATASAADMLLALAVLDLPFESPEHETELEDGRWSISAAGNAIIFHEEIRPAQQAEGTPILVSQNYFRHGDRYRQVGNERVDKFITEEFGTHIVYGAQLVITNPTSSRRKLDLLTQIPPGSIPVLSGQVTRGRHIDLAPFSTMTHEYYFYFPAPGQFTQYPAGLAQEAQLLTSTGAFTFNVVERLTQVDRESWDYISQHGSEEQVLEFLRTQNIEGGLVNLPRIAWRMRDEAFFQSVLDVLSARHVFDPVLWSYGIHHNHLPAIRVYLRHAEAFLAGSGPYLRSPLVDIDPIERHWYEHLEYSPLVNARAHELGRRRQILNDRFHTQYHKLMNVLAHKSELTDADRLAVTYYLLLQDRYEEAIAMLDLVDRERIATRLQYDYLKGWCGFLTGELDHVAALVERYAGHPVDRWGKRFAVMGEHLAQVQGERELDADLDPDDRSRRMDQLAARQQMLELEIEGAALKLEHRNLPTVTVNFYLMDLELLFSREPFMQNHSDQFSFIRPNRSMRVELGADASSSEIEIPEDLRSANLMVEVVGGSIRRSSPYFSNALAVTMVENYGQLNVTRRADGKPASAVYIKVFARMNDGQVRFYKDGYTDLRGRFDYATLSTNELDHVRRFSILIMSDDHGAIVRETAPPRR
ncbi:MAG: hypothetical protein JJU36_08470 [Phycisphaeraceae bacterium]|nr:hypothetical protein [Phycisphaeraceae bacterium]